MTILEKIKFEEDWLSEVNLTKENIKIALAGIRATVLEQQTSEDCISREDLLKRFKKECATDCSCCLYARDNDEIVEFGYREWCGLIEDAPSVTPKTEWIPVSERLPEDNVWVLVTVEQNGNRYQEIMRRHKYIDAWTDDIDNYTDEITAWMPIPEPYVPDINVGKMEESEDKE